MRLSLVAVMAVVFALALGGAALAQDSPTQDAYGGVLGNEVDDSGSADPQPAAQQFGAGDGSLPFTGFETGLVVLAGIGLVGLGFAMRRSTRRSST